MSPAMHRLPPETLAALAAGGGGADAVRSLAAAQDSKHRLLILGVVDWARRSGHPQAEPTARAYDLLAEIERAAPDAVRQVIRHPAVGAWANATLRALARGLPGSHHPAQLGAIAVAAAIRAGVPASASEVPAIDGHVMLPSVGRLAVDDPVVDVRTDHRLAVQPLHRLTTADGTFAVILDDLDPYRWNPDAAIPTPLSGNEREHWQRCLDDAWAILTTHHWSIAAETRAAVTALTPIKGPEVGQNSASARDRFGAVAMSTPPDGRWLASTFAHEIQHNKLGALLDILDLTLPDDPQNAPRFYAPWRPDPRPVSGLLQGAYAYLGVAGFWRRQRAYEDDLRPHIEFAHWCLAAHTTTGTLLDSGRLTTAGEEFVTRMRATLTRWLDEPVPVAAAVAADEEAASHRKAWEARNG